MSKSRGYEYRVEKDIYIPDYDFDFTLSEWDIEQAFKKHYRLKNRLPEHIKDDKFTYDEVVEILSNVDMSHSSSIDGEAYITFTWEEIIDMLEDFKEHEKASLIKSLFDKDIIFAGAIEESYSDRLRELQNKLNYTELEELCNKYGV
jgi:hypothetical protein